MRKRLLSLILALVMLCTMLPIVSLSADAATELSVTPNPKVEYGYTSETPVGTIRYIAQNRGSEYFSWNYWPTNSFGGYTGGPEIECGTACISMALSYVGVNRTPKALLEATNGYTGSMWGRQGDATSTAITISQSAISSAMDNYINGNGKYSPLCVYIVPFSATSDMHWVLLVGKLENNKYLALNPWHTSGTDGTFTIQVNGTTATYNGTTNPITSVNQWYNSNATPPLVAATYSSHCRIKVTASTTYIKSLPCSEATDASSTNVETASKNATYEAIGLYKNTAGNLWYKVQAKNGSTGYMYAGDTTFVEQLKDDLTVSGVAAPTELKKGSTFSIKGTIATQYQTITKVGAWVDNSSGTYVTGGTADVNTTSYNLNASSVDNAVRFNDLGAGKYTYCIGATIKSYYASSATAVSSRSMTVDLYESTFSVVENSACSHSYSSKVTTAATCTANGVRTYTCSECGASYTETIVATGSHNYVGKVTTEANCGVPGVRIYTCNGCGNSYTETIPATGNHSWGAWEVYLEATCTSVGINSRKCTVCGDEDAETVPATGKHNYVSAITSAATCGSDGINTYTCSGCSDEYTETIPATGNHTWGSWEITETPSCTQSGSQMRQCAVCSATETQAIPASGEHNYVGVVTTTATCGTEGIKTYTCQSCKDQYTEAIPATGNHVYVATITKEATCGSAGVKNYTCSGCSDEYTERIPATGDHNWGDWIVFEEASCTNAGYWERQCNVCKEYDCFFPGYAEHNLVTIPGYAATCTEDGLTDGLECSDCGEIAGAQEVIPATGHSWNKSWSDPKCTLCNVIGGTCGDNLEWTIRNRTFSINGFGEMPTLSAFSYPWYNVNNKIGYVYIGEGITSISDDAFWGCVGLKEVILPESLTSIGELSFFSCTLLDSVTIPANVKTIGRRAFEDCKYLTDVKILGQISSIERGTFYNCMRLTSVTIPNTVTSIGYEAFYGCSSLETITIPERVTDIHYSAFGACLGLNNIVVSENNPVYSSENGFVFNKDRTKLIIAPPNTMGKYIIPEYVTVIGDEAFRNCYKMQEIVVPNSISRIGSNAFHGCNMLSNIYYCGTETQWHDIKIDTNNSKLFSISKSFHSVTGDNNSCTDTCDICGYPLEHTFTNGICSCCGILESYIWQLSTDAIVDIALTEDLYVDLNGYDLSGTITTNGYKVYGMDSTTNEYACENMGYFNCVDENGNAIVPETVHQTEDLKRYMSIETDNGYTFHRFYLGITNVSLAPTVTGFGYKAEFYGDEMVQQQIASIGYNLWLSENHVVSRSTAFKNTLNLRLKNFDVVNYGETPVNASVNITLTDGTVIESGVTSMSMRDMLESINSVHTQYSEAQLTAVKEMIEKHAIIKSWDTENLYA